MHTPAHVCMYNIITKQEKNVCIDRKTDRRFNAECHEQKSQQNSHTAQMLTYMSKKVSKITIRPNADLQ